MAVPAQSSRIVHDAVARAQNASKQFAVFATDSGRSRPQRPVKQTDTLDRHSAQRHAARAPAHKTRPTTPQSPPPTAGVPAPKASSNKPIQSIELLRKAMLADTPPGQEMRGLHRAAAQQRG